ncbi:MAG TPA: hypothetical protein V6C89_08710 [Drouetiella sp.]|jgi:hypothetical protein
MSQFVSHQVAVFMAALASAAQKEIQSKAEYSEVEANPQLDFAPQGEADQRDMSVSFSVRNFPGFGLMSVDELIGELDLAKLNFNIHQSNESAADLSSIRDFGRLTSQIAHSQSCQKLNEQIQSSLSERSVSMPDFRHAVDDIFVVNPEPWQNN